LTTGLLQTHIGGKLTVEFRARLFDQVQRLSLSYHDSKVTADRVYRTEHDAQALEVLVVKGVIPFGSGGSTPVCCVGAPTIDSISRCGGASWAPHAC
jgi:ATP-binding cassette, subfamily B, bacterial